MHSPESSRKKLFFLLLAVLGLVSFLAPALDLNSLRVEKSPPVSVTLTWTDSTPTEFCIHRGVDEQNIPVFNATTALTYTDDPPPSAIWYYTVDETTPGTCLVSCTAAGTLQCGGFVTARNDDAGSTDVIDAYPACTTRDESGPEYVYSFSPGIDSLVSVYLADTSNGLDLFILEDRGAGCTPSACIGFSQDWIEFQAAAGATYYLVVDGFQSAVDDYSLSVDCFPQCSAETDVACGANVSGANDAAGSTNVLDLYNCSPKSYEGPEFSYRFSLATPQSQNVTVSLTGTAADLDVLRLYESGLGCVGLACSQFGDDTMQFTASPGIQYYLVVDGASGAVSGYDLAVACAPVACTPSGTLACGDTLTGRNDQPGSTDLITEYLACANYDETGPEVVYSFTTAVSSTVAVIDLSYLNGDIDLFLLEDRGNGCNPGDCLEYGDTQIVFRPTAGVRYYVVVDGFQGAVENYTLSLSCSDACSPAGPIECGIPIAANNGGAGSTDLLDAYPACTARDESGPEIAYTFTSATSASVNVSLTGTTQDLDIIVIRDTGFDCRPADCVAFGDTTASFGASPGSRHFIIVDGFQGAVGDFTLQLDCAPLACAPAKTIACGGLDAGRNDDPGSTDVMSSYPACWFADNTGPEMVYRFTSPTTGSVTAEIRTAALLNLLVLEDRGAGCTPDDCIGASYDRLTFDTTAGTDYFLVVDAEVGDIGDYTLSVSCGACDPRFPITCGETRPGDTTALGSTDAIDGYPACVARDMSGPEFAYTFEPQETTVATAALANMAPGLDVFVLEDAGFGCEPGGCVAWGDTSATFTAQAFMTYYIVVDGEAGASGTYDLTLTCLAPRCAPARDILCGDTVVARNDDPQSTNVIDIYDACVGWAETGPEMAYRFVATDPGSATAEITYDPVEDLDVFILEDDGTGCNPANCVNYDDLQASFAAVPGTTYYIVVDGYEGAVSDFTLTLTCAAGGCAAAADIWCGDTLSGNNTAPGSTDVLNSYPAACSTANFTEPEFVYRFLALTDASVTVDLVAYTNDLDVFVLEDLGNGCDPATCVGYGDTTTTFNAVGGGTYYIVIDGFVGPSDYDVTLTCN